MQEYIGNIVTNTSNNFNCMFNVVETFEHTIKNIPTLIIGLNNARKYISDFSIIKKGYNNSIYWTFLKTEKRCEYENDIVNFYNICIKVFLKDIKYKYINPTIKGYEYIKRLIKYSDSNEVKKCFLTKDSDFLFVYSKKYKNVFGLSLSLCEYMGVNREKVKKLVKRNKNNIFINNVNFITNEIREIIDNNKHYLLPLSECFSK